LFKVGVFVTYGKSKMIMGIIFYFFLAYWSSYDKHEVMKRTCITLRTGKFNKTFLYQEIWYKMIAVIIEFWQQA
jgi:hypothetical protein